MRRLRLAAALVAVAALLTVPGCGSDDERPAGASPTPTPDRPALAY